MGGRYVITLVTGHVLLIVWGYAVTAHEKVTSETVTLPTTYPDVLMATVAWFLLLGVAAFSAGAPRAAASPTRPGTTRTCTPTWRSRWRSATSSPTAPRSRQPGGPGRLVGPVRGGRRR